MALKRQQAAEDAIALHLASAESGTNYEYLPPGRIYGMQVTSPCPIPQDSRETSSPQDTTTEEEQEKPLDIETPPEKETLQPAPPKSEIVVSPASIEMLSKLFPNKKRAVLELVLKRCNHDLLKAIEHFNSKSSQPPTQNTLDVVGSEQHSSAFKPVSNKNVKLIPSTSHPGTTIPILTAGSKVFMHNFYPFLPLFNPQPVLQNPAVYVPGLCECEQCKHGLYARLDQRP